jgi:diguanylate cyclase (GGDEF)-like protein/PAS domain S-box-containing protein
MRISANEQTIPRLQLIGTLLIVLTLTLALGAFFTWHGNEEHKASLERIGQGVAAQHQARLQSTIDAAADYLDFTRLRTETVLRKSLRDHVDMALQVAQAIHARESPRLPAQEVQRKITEALRPVRFYDGRGYYFIDDMHGQFILLPTAPQLEGRTVLDNQDDRGHYIMRGLIDAARKPEGEGYSSYRWYTPDNPKVMNDKLAYVRYFAPYDWLIGTGDYTYKWEELQKQEVIARLREYRFGESGYIGLMDQEGRSLLSPSDSSMEGKALGELAPVQRAASQLIFDKATHGGGMVRYQWHDAGSHTMVAKTAMVRQVQPWGWILIVATRDDESQQALQHELSLYDNLVHHSWERVLVALVLAMGLGLAASWAFSRWSRGLFASYHADMVEKNRVLAETGELFRAVFDNAAVGIAQVALDGRFLQINESYCQLIGYTQQEVLGQAVTYQQISFPEDLAADAGNVQALQRGEMENHRVEKRYRRKDGSVVWASLAIHLVSDAERKPLYFITAVQDITARKAADQRLQLAANVFAYAREGIMITTPDGTIVEVNDAFTRITGYGRDEAIGQNPRLLKSNIHTASDYAAMWDTLLRDGHWVGETWNRHKSGRVFAELQTISAVKDNKGELQYYLSLFTDITPMLEHRQQLEHIAHYDALTDLPNRVLLADRLQQALTHSQRRRQSVAVLYLDLDGFKEVNDQYGHDRGDQLLVLLAKRLKETLRDGDTLSRIGGDEFVAVLVDVNSPKDCEPVLQRMLDAASGPLLIGGDTLQVSASIGVTLFPKDQSDADLLLRHADQAMYLAKQAGKNRYHWFDVQQDASMQSQRETIAELKAALATGEVELHYQPKVNLRTGQIVGAEGLIRWRHTQRGLLYPADFLPTVQDPEFAALLGEWVIDTALSQVERWRVLGLDVVVSVNVDAQHLQQDDFVERLQGLFSHHPGVRPDRLQLEVLETSALDDMATVEQLMNACGEMGVGFALDDFGTGYSSLRYLKHLPAHTLKIDQGFVRDMLEDPNDLAIVEGVIGLARAFGREVIAEGVESAAHGERLLAMGCELVQGYGIARAMPAEQFPPWAAQWGVQSRWSQT